jgi:hypothetical protein
VVPRIALIGDVLSQVSQERKTNSGTKVNYDYEGYFEEERRKVEDNSLFPPSPCRARTFLERNRNKR